MYLYVCIMHTGLVHFERYMYVEYRLAAYVCTHNVLYFEHYVCTHIIYFAHYICMYIVHLATLW